MATNVSSTVVERQPLVSASPATDIVIAKKTSTTYWVIAVIIAIVIIIIIIIIIVIATRGTTVPLVATSPTFRVQRATVSSGTDTFQINGNSLYIAAPIGSPITLAVVANTNNSTGTILAVKNESNPSTTTSQPIILSPQSGVSITSGTFPNPLVVVPGAYAQYVATGPNTYIRLT